MKPREHPCWPAFTTWAETNGVEPDGHPDDWTPWWECFTAGRSSEQGPDPHAGEQAVAVAEHDAGPNGTPKLGLTREAKILREMRHAVTGLAGTAPVISGGIALLLASNTAYQATAQEPRVEPGTGIDEYKRDEEEAGSRLGNA